MKYIPFYQHLSKCTSHCYGISDGNSGFCLSLFKICSIKDKDKDKDSLFIVRFTYNKH